MTLTVRTNIQHVVEDELDRIVQTYSPDGAYIIVMNPRTGEILAIGLAAQLRSERPPDDDPRPGQRPLHHLAGRAGLDLQDHHPFPAR